MQKRKKLGIVFLAIFLIITNIVIVSGIIAGGKKEIKATEEFIEKLEDIHAIPQSNYKKNNFESVDITSNKNIKTPTKYTVRSGNFGVDLDKDYRVIGFSLNNGVQDQYVNDMTEEEAISLAEEYVANITTEQFKFKEVKKVHTDEENYDIKFYKYYDGYPYYNLDIEVKIHKKTGVLTGYYNTNPINTIVNKEKNITIDEAKVFAKNYCESIGIDYVDVGSPSMYYFSSNDEAILSYEFKFEPVPINNGKEFIRKTVFISAKDGRVIFLKEDIEK